MANIVTTITESVTINGKEQGGKTSKTISNINDIFKRVILVPTSETILYETDASTVTGSKLDRDNVKYVRITNLSPSNTVDIILTNEDNDEAGIALKSGTSLILWDHATVLDSDETSAIGVTAQAAATATLSVADGDLASSGQFTEGEYVKFISTNGTVGIFILSDSSETGAVASGTVLTGSSDLGLTVPSASLLAQGVCVAVTMNLNTCSQALLLNELRDTMGAITSPLLNKISGAAGTVPSSDGVQSLVFTQAVSGTAGNTITTTNISQLTAADFSSGANAQITNKNHIKKVEAIANASASRVEILIAST